MSFGLFAQEVRVIDNKGTIEKIRNNNVYTSNADPNVSPNNVVENDIWLDTSTSPTTTKVFDDNGDWVVLTTGASTHTGFFTINAPGSLANAPFTVEEFLPFEPTQITFVAHPNVENMSTNGDNSSGNNSNNSNNTFGTMNGYANIATGGTTQGVIFVGASGNSINDISRYSSSANCIGIRYANQNADNLGVLTGELTAVNSNTSTNVYSFEITVDYSANGIVNEGLVVFYTAYK